MATFAPRISSAFLKSLDISTVVAEYETFFSRGGEQKRRGKNIDNAVAEARRPRHLAGRDDQLQRRSSASAARRTASQKSWEIFKGEMVEGVGGGTCQVASTFHAATFFAGFDVLERLPHSRPSAYIPMGLDSTVVYPAVDLKVRNPHPFPVVVHAKTDGNKLRVELLGKMRPVDVELRSRGRLDVAVQAQDRRRAGALRQEGPRQAARHQGLHASSARGCSSTRTARRKKEELTDFYPPTTEIYKVPVGFDVALLPPLPGGEGEDSDLGGNPSAAPASARAPRADHVATRRDRVAPTRQPAERRRVRRCARRARADGRAARIRRRRSG